MAYYLSEPAPSKGDPTAKNRAWDFFGERTKPRPANRRKPLQPRRKNRPSPTKPASGIPYWPSRDPIGESGGVNLYGFCGNSSIGRVEIFGQWWKDVKDLGWKITGHEYIREVQPMVCWIPTENNCCIRRTFDAVMIYLGKIGERRVLQKWISSGHAEAEGWSDLEDWTGGFGLISKSPLAGIPSEIAKELKEKTLREAIEEEKAYEEQIAIAESKSFGVKYLGMQHENVTEELYSGGCPSLGCQNLPGGRKEISSKNGFNIKPMPNGFTIP